MRSQSSASKYSSLWQNDTHLRSVGSCAWPGAGDALPDPLGVPRELPSSGVYGGEFLRQLFIVLGVERGPCAMCGGPRTGRRWQPQDERVGICEGGDEKEKRLLGLR